MYKVKRITSDLFESKEVKCVITGLISAKSHCNYYQVRFKLKTITAVSIGITAVSIGITTVGLVTANE